jgi:hypothetical protein
MLCSLSLGIRMVDRLSSVVNFLGLVLIACIGRFLKLYTYIYNVRVYMYI